jgi:acyl-CoA thioester hydrolase
MTNMSEPKWFTHTIRVRYQETDQMGIVYHTNYVNWMEWGRTELIREAGMPYQDIEARGLLLPIVNLNVQFKTSAKYDDVITIHTCIEQATSLRVAFAYRIQRGDEVLITGTSEHVWLNGDYRPVRLEKQDPDLYQLIQKLSNPLT